MTKENRIVAYPAPYIKKLVVGLANSNNESNSVTITKIISEYFRGLSKKQIIEILKHSK